uniref:Uncharacterized protein n=1 Tax=Anguilla anguilla TaxID=7936 RepID=A0A0E9PUC1_ANGAN
MDYMSRLHITGLPPTLLYASLAGFCGVTGSCGSDTTYFRGELQMSILS